MLDSGGYVADDFDLDDGLDLQQFEYNSHPTRERRPSYDDLRYFPDDDYSADEGLDHDRTFGYRQEHPYVTQYSDNVVMKTLPEYENLGTMQPSRERFSYDLHDRGSVKSRARPVDMYYARSRNEYHHDRAYRYEEEPPLYHDYDEKPQHEGRYRYDEGFNTSRYIDSKSLQPNSSSRRDADGYSVRSYKTSYSHAKSHKSSSKSKKAKKEKIREFPPPDTKAPIIPLPDYEGAEVGAKYVPGPDY